MLIVSGKDASPWSTVHHTERGGTRGRDRRATGSLGHRVGCKRTPSISKGVGGPGVTRLGLCAWWGEGDRGSRWGAEAWERGEGGAGRGVRPLLRSGNSAPALSTPSSSGLLPERPRIPRPRAAQRPSSARRSPGEGPGIAAAGEAKEARGARVTSPARGRRGAAGGVWGRQSCARGLV